MMDALVASIIPGSVGFVLLYYGKRQSRIPHVIAGLPLMVMPYAFDGILPGVALTVGVLAVLWVAVRHLDW